MAIEITGEERIAMSRDQVWRALNDPTVLKECIPGCEVLEVNRENSFSAVVVLKIGPIKARFNSEVELSNIEAPRAYTISGEGKGGIAGFAKGAADVTLGEDGADITLLTYTARAEIGGKIAQLGSRLIQSTSKKLASEFFARFNALISAP